MIKTKIKKKSTTSHLTDNVLLRLIMMVKALLTVRLLIDCKGYNWLSDASYAKIIKWIDFFNPL